MTKTIDKTQELGELERLIQRKELTDKQVGLRLLWMSKVANVPQDELALVVHKSQSQVSRMLRSAAQAPEAAKIIASGTAPAATAMELIRRAGRGEIARDELVRLLKGWEFDPQVVTHSLLDEWNLVDNSVDAIVAAYDEDLITEDEYEELVAAAKVA